MKPAQHLSQAASPRLGAHCDEAGVNFALFSAHAERVEVCLFDPQSGDELDRTDLHRDPDGIWSGHVASLTEGAHYGYRVHGPWAPAEGHRFNPHKLLLDPYARQLSAELKVQPEHFAFIHDSDDMDTRDSAGVTPKCVVMADAAPLEPLPLNGDRVIYEAHVRGMTMRHPHLPEEIRGRFAGMADSQIIDYLRDLGITAVELMPIHFAVDEQRLAGMGLGNYWRYNSVGFFAPDYRYGDLAAFRALVDRLHDAGVEVVLDVVYNHTGEGDHFGPNLCFRGIDNASYYRLQSEDRRFYVNDTGCGNTLDVSHPQVRLMVLDSLRYWAALGVDGFRFDLATALARENGEYNPAAAFFTEIEQDPLLKHRRLIAEPWDIGPDGYRVGQFPAPWAEWNDRYRDTVRRFWRGDEGLLPELARRLHGSGDLFEDDGRPPAASVNFITSHDGFTLTDLVSYEQKHNAANGEDNRDGHNNNLSTNCGVEGPTDDARVLALRLRQRRNLMGTLLLSQGTPMLTMGDEIGRSQGGNNNAYCQDNETSWVDWSALDRGEDEFLEYVRYIVGLRMRYPLLAWPDYMHDTGDDNGPRCRWYDSNGEPMNEASWHRPHQSWLGKLLSAPGSADLCLLINASAQNIPFQLPDTQAGCWRTLLDTANQDYTGGSVQHEADGPVLLRQRSLHLLIAESCNFLAKDE